MDVVCHIRNNTLNL